MTTDTRKQLLLANQFLTHPDKRLTVVQALNGFQAQYLSNALHAARLRSVDFDADRAADGLVKSWTIRGTMHIFAASDLPLFLHSGCRYHSRDWTVPSFWNQRPGWALPRGRDDGGRGSVDVSSLRRRHPRAVRARLSLRCRQRGKSISPLPAVYADGGG